MANDFATVKENVGTEKISLVRIQSAREVGASLSLSSGTTYTHTFHQQAVQKVVVDGTVYTLVTGTPSSEEYSYDESTMLLTINLGTAYSAQEVVVFFYLFFSKDQGRIAYQTPTDNTTAERYWEPRLAREPNTKQDFRNITDGKLTVGATAIRLENQDRYFEQYLGDNDSFANKEVAIWFALDDTENAQIAFKGVITRISVGLQVTIDIDDVLSLLNQTYYSNGSYLSSTFNTTKFPNMDPAQENTPIRKVFGRSSKYEVVAFDVTNLLYELNPNSMLNAVCTDYDREITTSNNRAWGTSFDPNWTYIDSVAPASVDNTDPDYTEITITGMVEGDFLIGEAMTWNKTANPLRYTIVQYVDADNDVIRVTKDATLDTTWKYIQGQVDIIIIQDDAWYYPLLDRDYSLSTTTNNVRLVTFNSSLESNTGMSRTLDPAIDQVRFRMRNDPSEDYEHGTILQTALEAVGLDVNAASISTANGTSLEVDFTLPFNDDLAFPTFGNIVEALLRSTFGYLTFNSSLELEYHLFATPSPSASDTRDEHQIIKESFNYNIDYTRLYDSLTPINKHNSITLDYTNVGVESTKAKYLHEVDRNREFVHVLAVTDRIDEVLNVISERKMEYQYSTKTIDLDSLIGDDFELSGITLPGNGSTKDVKIIQIDKRPNKVVIVASDLLGL